jgi:hypothetical protein
MNTQKENAVIACQFRIDTATMQKSILVDALDIVTQFEGKTVNKKIATALNVRLATSYGQLEAERYGGVKEKYNRVSASYRRSYFVGNTQYYDFDIYYCNIENLPKLPDGYDFREMSDDKTINLHFSGTVSNLLHMMHSRMEGLANEIRNYTEAIAHMDTIEALAKNAKEARADYDRATDKVYTVNRFFEMTR